ncbi:unnamed protein product [Ambrosiozyma monospora]|uniref:Unnamed protein product n=1 Tax=Ambrosiozyma monospora TaxID=43982 RepID=A0ACB5SUK8_AMBMO|nr:unnamed protein product [Ambrosiozyma monospora]
MKKWKLYRIDPVTVVVAQNCLMTWITTLSSEVGELLLILIDVDVDVVDKFVAAVGEEGLGVAAEVVDEGTEAEFELELAGTTVVEAGIEAVFTGDEGTEELDTVVVVFVDLVMEGCCCWSCSISAKILLMVAFEKDELKKGQMPDMMGCDSRGGDWCVLVEQ